MKKINTDKAPAAIGPYSQGIITGEYLLTSGQIPAEPVKGEIVGGGIAEQTEQVCKNVGAVLAAGGATYDQVIKTTCFLADMADFGTFNEIYAKYFTGKPARSCIAARALPKGVLCEVEVIACLKEE